MNSTEKLTTKLVELGATLRPPASPHQIAEVERRLRCSFPESMKAFYQSCDGVDGATLEWVWDFFSLKTVIERTEARRKEDHLLIDKSLILPYQNLVCFCDVLIDAPTYLFCANPNDKHFGYFYADQGHEGWLVADSYEAFVDIFIAQHDSILLNLR